MKMLNKIMGEAEHEEKKPQIENFLLKFKHVPKSLKEREEAIPMPMDSGEPIAMPMDSGEPIP
eukprot:CAMPEP_0205812452 /NCGR_PEP_ID=MMETSP0205-20121125/16892_1 /ASSEMBLY_ACC=CAM_ASM_000278 /TAXON_ID=36767 /ORGANISM="Euplotes focardii, Strain TN1" /LENGTH=62 /DNA_ID=CAMNT_0053093117 /DNA_START=26 /DNA_END=211 /DNA_ORIENTATION=-